MDFISSSISDHVSGHNSICRITFELFMAPLYTCGNAEIKQSIPQSMSHPGGNFEPILIVSSQTLPLKLEIADTRSVI